MLLTPATVVAGHKIGYIVTSYRNIVTSYRYPLVKVGLRKLLG
jgi:hypothetical protein